VLPPLPVDEELDDDDDEPEEDPPLLDPDDDDPDVFADAPPELLLRA
jgi:hypothetical protein